MTATVNTLAATGAGGTVAAIAAGVGINGLAYITGTPSVGNLLTANTVSGLTGTSWQWTRDGGNITGATSQTYTVQTADGGHLVAVVVNGILTSNSVSIPTPATFPNLTSPKIGLVGDSITEFNNLTYSLTVGTNNVTRDSSGVIAAPAPGNFMVGTPEVIPVNLADTSFEVLGQNNFLASSTLGTEAGGSSAASVYTANTTVATTSALTNSAVIMQNRFSWRGLFSNLQCLFKGGLEFVANNGHGGLSAPFGTAVSYMVGLAPNAIFYLGGTNNVKGGQNATTTYNNILIDLAVIMAANIPCIVHAVIPLGTVGNPSYATENATIQSVNSMLSSYCAANPTQLLFVDIFTPLYNSSITAMYANYTTDGTHPVTLAANAAAQAMYTALTPYITAPTVLSRQSSDQGTVINGHTRTVARGPWVTTSIAYGTAPFTNAGGSGTIATGWSAGRASGSGTAACSVFDPGDGLGIKVQVVATAGAANDQVLIWPWGSGGATPATFGATNGSDTTWYQIAVEVDWSNATAAGVGQVVLAFNAPGGQTYGTSSFGEGTSEAAGQFLDSVTAYTLRSGWLQMSNTSLTAIVPNITIKFGSITGVAFTINVRDVTILKR